MASVPVGWLIAGALFALPLEAAMAATEDLGNGFRHHGIATPVSNHRGIVATQDGEGRDVVLVWLFDHTGGYALLMIDAATGKAEQVPTPFPSGGDCPYASILSTRNRYYTHFGNHFCEFDPAKRAFTFVQQTAPQMAMSMTEDDSGVIWSATYPSSGVASYDPASGEFRDYGHVHPENWPQYPRSVAADDTGWIYFGIGPTNSQVCTLDRAGGAATPVIPEAERGHGYGTVYRDLNGKVYASPRDGATDGWYELYGGQATRIGPAPAVNHKPIITGSQGLVHTAFQSGKRLKSVDLTERRLTVTDPATGADTTVAFDYTSAGAHLMGLATSPDGTIVGGTAFPFCYFRYDPKADTWENRACLGQWNTVARQGDRFYAGIYGGGGLLEWDPTAEWVPTVEGQAGCNPQFLAKCEPTINRPHDLLAHPDGKTLVLAGTPGYGFTGGGLMIWDRETKQATVLTHTDLLPEQSTMGLVALEEGLILGGTTTSPGTGGEKKATEAELYILDLATRKIEWHAVVYPGAQNYTDLCRGPRGLVYGIVDQSRFFVFDPRSREVVHEEMVRDTHGPTTSQQGPRVFVQDGAGHIYLLFVKGVAQVDPETFAVTMLAESPVPIGPGGDHLDGRIYFGSGSHVYSYQLP
jgi:hypothetical protein